MRGLARIVLIGLAIVIVAGGTLTPNIAHAERSTPMHMGLGIGSVVATVPYGIAKTLYAVGGTITGGLAYVLTGGRGDVARAIIQPAVRGDYVVTPSHLTMAESLNFSGSDPLQSGSRY